MRTTSKGALWESGSSPPVLATSVVITVPTLYTVHTTAYIYMYIYRIPAPPPRLLSAPIVNVTVLMSPSLHSSSSGFFGKLGTAGLRWGWGGGWGWGAEYIVKLHTGAADDPTRQRGKQIFSLPTFFLCHSFPNGC